MAVRELIERVVQWQSQSSGSGEWLARARAQFEDRTAPVEIDQPDYESRIAHFLDWFVCQYGAPEAPAVVEAFAAHHANLSTRERVGLAGLLRSQRSLYRVERASSPVQLADLLTGAVFEVRPEADAMPLSVGDIFDGRVAAGPDGLEVAPGKVFHPASAHTALLTLVAQARGSHMDRDALLDALLGMRDRLFRFTRVKPEHLYRLEAIGSEPFSATWTLSRPPPGGE